MPISDLAKVIVLFWFVTVAACSEKNQFSGNADGLRLSAKVAQSSSDVANQTDHTTADSIGETGTKTNVSAVGESVENSTNPADPMTKGSAEPTKTTTENETTDEFGISGGHFDLDTYAGNNLERPTHEHQYDDKCKTTGVDFLTNNTCGKKIDIDDTIGNNIPFTLEVLNANLSVEAVININGLNYPVTTFSNFATIFVTAGSSSGAIQLSSLSVNFPKEVISISNGIVSLTPSVAQKINQTSELYRGGALTLRAVNPSNRSEVLWEAAIYRHQQ
jgi:hypothetical protein